MRQLRVQLGFTNAPDHALEELAGAVIAAVAAVLGAVVRYDETGGRQGGLQTSFDFGRYRAFCGNVHAPIYADYRLTR